jgi:glycosyltransferase involved in cell wall biosynthesis
MSNPFVSVIIPVFNDSERLRLCLNALENQTYPKESYEVIVIDNNSEEDIASVVKSFKQMILTHESRRGSYAARNKGLSLAKGEVLGFTDSDCIPKLDWIEKGVALLSENPDCGLIAGKIELFFKKSGQPTATELYDSMNFLQQKNYVEEKRYGATANLFTFRKIFDAVGLFNIELQSGGDKEWGNRVFNAGFAQIYGEDVCIAHPARGDLKELQRKVVRITEGHFFINDEANKPLFEFLGELYWDIKPPIRGLLEIFLNKEIKGIRQKFGYSAVVLSLRSARSMKKIELYFGRKTDGRKTHQQKAC